MSRARFRFRVRENLIVILGFAAGCGALSDTDGAQAPASSSEPGSGDERPVGADAGVTEDDLPDPEMEGSGDDPHPQAPDEPDVGSFERPFPAAQWLYDPIPADPAIDPESAAIVLMQLEGQHVALLHEFGIPIYRADASTPRLDVSCTVQGWGPCALDVFGPRPLTAQMLPHLGSDGAMVVIDETHASGERVGRSVDGYWQYAWNDGTPQTSFGDIADLDGDGRGDAATGAGVSRAAGVVRAYEIERGLIDHALVFSTSFCELGASRFPATKDDGTYQGLGAIPEGARIQLDPTLSPDDFVLGSGERAVFVALQTYGAYAIDCGAATMAFSFEEVDGDPGQAYEDAGLAWDYYDFLGIPWDRIRVLASWNGR